jgi:hypothetical protein
MKRRQHAWVLVIAATLTCAACTSGPSAPSGANAANTPISSALVLLARRSHAGAQNRDLDPAISAPTSRPLWPMKPGTRGPTTM